MWESYPIRDTLGKSRTAWDSDLAQRIKGHLLARKLGFGQSGNFLGAVASNLITKKCVDIERQRPADVKAGGVHDQGQAGLKAGGYTLGRGNGDG
jgi:hypothetical protein